MSGVRGNPATLRRFQRNLTRVPVKIATSVATTAAPAITGLAQSAYSSGETVYGEPRPLGVHGNVLTLVASGDTQGALQFQALGRVVRARLGTRQARYLVGKYKILPTGGLPVAWNAELRRITLERLKEIAA